MKSKKWQILTNGILKENPTFVLLLGMCPTLAITTGLISAVGMGLATTFVLVGSNTVVSLLRKIIHKSIRIPAYIVVIAGFVTLVEMLLKAYVPSLYSALGIYLPLIVVNCIILGRAELFAGKNTVPDSALDGLGMGLGFTLALSIMGSIREFFGTGCIADIPITESFLPGMTFFILPAGGFFTLGMIIATVRALRAKKQKKEICEVSACAGCANRNLCQGKAEEA